MDIVLLNYFLTVAKTQHMTKAAQQLNITQPSLSSAIRRLESELGVTLFDRVGRNIQLNEYGMIFYKGASAAVQSLSSSMDEIEMRKKSMTSFIRLACSRSPTNSQLIDFLLAKGVNMKIDTVPQNWDRQLLDRTCDLVITAGPAKSFEIESYPLLHQELVIVCGMSHPLALSTQVNATELNYYPFCSTDASHSLINVAGEQLSALGISPRITFLGQNSTDMLRAIHTGQFLGLMVKRNLPDDKKTVILPIQDFDISIPIYLHWSKHTSHLASLAAIRQIIIDFYQGLPIQS